MATESTRFSEIDLLRGLAIIGMVIYHFLFDLSFFYNFPITVDRGFFYYLARAVAVIFLLLVGMSLVFSFKNSNNSKTFISTHLKRSFFILFFALLVSASTYLIFPNSYIVFGILHLIGISIILTLPLLFTNSLLPTITTFFLVVICTFFIKSLHSTNYFLIPFGITPFNYSSFDYFPIFPWLEIVIMGIFIGKLYYPWRIHQNNIKIPGFFTTLSVRSLFIYLIHQPVILLALLIIKTIFRM